MNDKDKSQLAKAARLRDELVNEAESLSDAEIRESLIESNVDLDAVDARMRQLTFNLVVDAKKARLKVAAQKVSAQPMEVVSTVKRGIDAIRKTLSALAENRETLAGKKVALAFRNGTAQSDSDVLSLWQDLVDLGAVTDDDLPV